MSHRFLQMLCAFMMVVSLMVAMPVSSLAVEDTAGSAIPSVAATSESANVFVILAPYLSWDDITQQTTPVARQLLERSAMANMVTLSRSRGDTDPVASEMAATLSAGYWARGIEGIDNIENAQALESAISGSITLGTLGQAVHDVAGSTIAIGNSALDTAASDVAAGVTSTPRSELAPATIVAMDTSGIVDGGDTSAAILKADPTMAYGVRTDADALSDALQAGLVTARASVGPDLFVVDSGDMYRYGKAVASGVAAREVTQGSAQEADGNVDTDELQAVSDIQHRAALSSFDSTVHLVLDAMDEGDLLVIAASLDTVTITFSTDAAAEVEAFSPCVLYRSPDDSTGLDAIRLQDDGVIARSGFQGVLSSSSTHRQGLITAMDVTATVLDHMTVAVPVQVVGAPVVLSGTSPSTATDALVMLEDANTHAATVDATRDTALTILGTTIALVLALSLVAVVLRLMKRDEIATKASYVARILLMGALAFPPATLLMFITLPASASASITLISCLGWMIVLWMAAGLIWHAVDYRLALAGICATLVVVAVGDQLLGAPLSVGSYMGYSLIEGARFYGLGNEYAALIFGASLVGIASWLDGRPEGAVARIVRARTAPALLVFPAVLLFLIIVMAAPFWGANIGVAVWGIAGYGVAWALMSGRKITVRMVLIAVATVIIMIVLFVFIDLYGGQTTHLAQTIVSVGNGGIGGLGDIIMRKVALSAQTLTNTPFAVPFIIAFIVFIVMRVRPYGIFVTLWHDNPALAATANAAIVGSLVALLTEDSGLAIPAYLFLYIGVAVFWRILAQGEQRSETTQGKREEDQ